MVELTGEELREGNRQLGGIRVLYWVILSLSVISTMINIFYIFYIPNLYLMYLRMGLNLEEMMPQRIFVLIVVFNIILNLIYITIAVIALIGMKNRRSYSVPLGRVILVLTMFSVPVGTIAGAILWGRLSNPAAKKYLNYGV
ncbi:MAG: hypothetical protein U9O59_04120 [Actinomycetota bacterium]|nr:hypothetical protein [Actinomycetota bacterium]